MRNKIVFALLAAVLLVYVFPLSAMATEKTMAEKRQEMVEKDVAEIMEDREEAAAIREAAIAAGTWGKKATDPTQETTAQVEVSSQQDTVNFDVLPWAFASAGFTLGVLIAVAICHFRIKRIKAECEARVSEARASLDRVVALVSNDRK